MNSYNYTISKRLLDYTRQRGVKFVELGCDHETKRFIAQQDQLLASGWQMLGHSVARLFMSHYDANALFGIYPLFLMSKQHLRAMTSHDYHYSTALDIGCGDGSMAQYLLRDHVEQLYGTETSERMGQRAEERKCFDQILYPFDLTKNQVPEWQNQCDLVLLLNVLDRTNRPVTLLQQAKQYMKKEMIISTPLPFRPHFYNGSKIQKPAESFQTNIHQQLPQMPNPWETEALWFLFHVLQDFKVLQFARLPYISLGDVQKPLYTYDNILVHVTFK